MATIEFCTNDEWLMQGLEDDTNGTGLQDSDVATELVDVAVRAAERDPRLSGCRIERAGGQRILYHGWNGAHFTHRCGIFGTFGDLTQNQEAALFDADKAGREAANKMLADARAESEATDAADADADDDD